MSPKNLIAHLFFFFGFIALNFEASAISKPKCQDREMFGAFIDTERCLTFNDPTNCTAALAIAKALGGAALGSTAIDLHNSISYNQRFRTFPPIFDNLDLDRLLVSNPSRREIRSSGAALNFEDETWLRFKANYTKISEADQQLTKEARKILKKMGYADVDMLRIQDELIEYKEKLVETRHDREVGNRLNPEARDILVKQMIEIDDQMAQLRGDKVKANHSKTFQKLAEQRSQLAQQLDAVLADMTADPFRALKTKTLARINNIPRTPFRPKSVIGGAFVGATAGAAVGMSGQIADAAVNLKCKSHELFGKEPDKGASFKNHASFDFSTCAPKLEPKKIWEILLMNQQQRARLLERSPLLCQAFENSFTDSVKKIESFSPQINYSRTQCSGNQVTTMVKVANRVYSQKYEFFEGKIQLTGLFFSTNAPYLEYDANRKQNETYTMAFDRSGKWSGVDTKNPVWLRLMDSKKVENNLTFSQLSLNNPFYNCIEEGQKPLTETQRRDVTIDENKSRLVCAVRDQTFAFQSVLPLLAKYCEEKFNAISRFAVPTSATPAGAPAAQPKAPLERAPTVR